MKEMEFNYIFHTESGSMEITASTMNEARAKYAMSEDLSAVIKVEIRSKSNVR